MQLDLIVVVKKALQMRGDVQPTKRGGGRYAQRPARLFRPAGDQSLGILDCGQYGDGPLVKGMAGIGRRKPPRRPLKQPRTKPLFKTGDGLDRKSVVSGKGVSVRVDPGGRRIRKKKKT